MVYRRTYRRRYIRPRRTYRRRYTRPRRRYFKRSYRGRRSRNRWYNKKYNYKEHYKVQAILLRPIEVTTTTIRASYSLVPNSIPGWAVHSSGCDQYKIYKWKLTVEAPDATVMPGLPGSLQVGLETVKIYLASDYNDTSTTYLDSAMLNAVNRKVRSWNRSLSYIIRPRLQKTVYETGVTTGQGYSPGFAWINVSDSQVPHFGFKLMIDNNDYHVQEGQYPQLIYNVYYTVYYGFKNNLGV